MNTTNNILNIKLYDIARKSFNLSEEQAKDFALAIEESRSEHIITEIQHISKIIQKDISNLQNYLDMQFEHLNTKFENLPKK